jgi:HD-like signal output (HDOD) protein
MTFVASGAAALDHLAKEPADVIIADMRMPGMDGVTLLEHVRSRFPEVVRIVLSGYAELQEAMRVAQVAHQFLTKPCEADVLRAVVERSLDLREALVDPALRQTVGAMESLPSLPRTYAALSRVLGNPDAALSDIARVIEEDAGMAVKILQLVNSSFFGIARRVSSVQAAVNLLGVTTVRSLVLATEVFRAFEVKTACPSFSLEALQRHMLLAARIARQIPSGRRDQEDAFMAAMLSDVGVLVLASRLPGELERALATAAAAGTPLHLVEEELGMVGHARIGAYLLGLWGLPFSIEEAVAYHHRPSWVAHARFDVLTAVHAADALAAASGAAGGATPELDLAHLERAGVLDRVPQWQALAAREHEAVAA